MATKADLAIYYHRDAFTPVPTTFISAINNVNFSTWPFAVARIFGRCLDISSAVSPGHVEKLTFFIAEINVVGTGKKRHGGNTLRDLDLWPWRRRCLLSSF